MVTISIGIMIRNNYVFFKDPALFLIVFVIVCLAMLIKFVIMFVTGNYLNIWKLKSRKQLAVLPSIEGFINNSGELNLESMMEAELIRKHFISYNKEWLIKQLSTFVKQENFEENNKYLLNLYEILMIEEQKEEKEKKREHLIKQKNLQKE